MQKCRGTRYGWTCGSDGKTYWKPCIPKCLGVKVKCRDKCPCSSLGEGGEGGEHSYFLVRKSEQRYKVWEENRNQLFFSYIIQKVARDHKVRCGKRSPNKRFLP